MSGRTYQGFASSPNNKDKESADWQPQLDVFHVERSNLNPIEAASSDDEKDANDGLDEEHDEVQAELGIEDVLQRRRKAQCHFDSESTFDTLHVPC